MENSSNSHPGKHKHSHISLIHSTIIFWKRKFTRTSDEKDGRHPWPSEQSWGRKPLSEAWWLLIRLGEGAQRTGCDRAGECEKQILSPLENPGKPGRGVSFPLHLPQPQSSSSGSSLSQDLAPALAQRILEILSSTSHGFVLQGILRGDQE